VTFPKAGNFKFVCLIHTDMTGTVHVLPNTAESGALIHNQHFYDEQGRKEAEALLNYENPWPELTSDHEVLAGMGKILGTAGGQQYLADVRFFPEIIRIHAGESIVWANLDPTEPHTVTFGDEPASLVPTLYSLPPTITYPAGPPIPNPPAACSSVLTTNCQNADTGTILATINCTTSPAATAGTTPCDAAFKPQEDSVSPPPPPYDKESFLNSGFLQAAEPDRTGTAQVPPGTTRIRITFPKKGIYTYHCALHDVDGMYGTVIVE
jgi:plastocyanin